MKTRLMADRKNKKLKNLELARAAHHPAFVLFNLRDFNITPQEMKYLRRVAAEPRCVDFSNIRVCYEHAILRNMMKCGKWYCFMCGHEHYLRKKAKKMRGKSA